MKACLLSPFTIVETTWREVVHREQDMRFNGIAYWMTVEGLNGLGKFCAGHTRAGRFRRRLITTKPAGTRAPGAGRPERGEGMLTE